MKLNMEQALCSILDARDQTFNRMSTQFVHKERVIQELKTAHNAAQAQLEQLVKEKQQHENDLSRMLKTSEGRLEEKEAVIQELKTAYENTQALLTQFGREKQQHDNEHYELLRKLENSEARLENKEAVIQELKTAHNAAQDQLEQLKKEKCQQDHELASYKDLLGTTESKIAALTLQLSERDNTIRVLTDSCLFYGINGSSHTNLALVKSLDEKESVIQELAKALNTYRAAFGIIGSLLRPGIRIKGASARIKNRFHAVVAPRLGNLNQYAPRPRCLPERYVKAVASSDTPTISIVTPSYGQAKYIARTIDSVLSQNYPNLEYFVQDGGSTDGTVVVLKAYSDRLSGWESAPDGGQSHAINLGFAKTSGEIMAWLNSDDCLLPGALDCVADYFARHPQVDVVYGNRLLIDENDLEIGRWILPCHDGKALSWVDYVPQETLFWRRALWEKVGGNIDESFRFAMDWDLLVRFRDADARFAHIPRFLGAFRIHEHQKTSAAINEIGHKEMDRIRERLHGKVPSRKEIRKAVIPFMLKHIAVDMLYRVKTRRVGKQ